MRPTVAVAPDPADIANEMASVMAVKAIAQPFFMLYSLVMVSKGYSCYFLYNILRQTLQLAQYIV